MTDAEKKLWYKISKKQLGIKFRRQQPIGRYIVDFVCFENKVIIEIDGGQHDQCVHDTKRDKWFINQEGRGIVIEYQERIWGRLSLTIGTK